MADQRYDDIVITRGAPRVDEAPEYALIEIALLCDMAGGYFISQDVIFIGLDQGDEAIYYRVVGWNCDEKALVVQRWTDSTD